MIDKKIFDISDSVYGGVSEKKSGAIFALSSASGKAGVAVFRVSGDADAVLDVVRKMTKLDPGVVSSRPRFAHFAEIFHSQTHEKIDDAIIVFFPAPHSFTGEYVLEIQSHGGIAVVRSVLNSLSSVLNLKMAERGEFTKRAFFNGKMDLLRVEGLADLIDATTETSRRQALLQMGGEFSMRLAEVREKLVSALSLATAQIDFLSDEANTQGENQSSDDVQSQMISCVRGAMDELRKMLSNRVGEIIRSGLSVAIVGAPNVGKSSLFNAIVGREKSIISSIPGTTRDIVDAVIDVDGVAVELADTAGLRETADIIENEGISRAIARAENSDVKILVMDSEKIPPEISIDGDTIVVVNKLDLLGVAGKIDASRYPVGAIFASVKTGEGLADLKNILCGFVRKKTDAKEGAFITRERHKVAIKNASEFLEEILNLQSGKCNLDLQAENLKLALYEIEQLTGRVYFNDLLDEIFGSFCIGK